MFKPEMNVVKYEVTDVITTSTCPSYCDDCEWHGGDF